MYKEVGTGRVLTLPLSSIVENKNDTTIDGVDVFHEFLKAFNSNIFFEDSLKFLVLKIKWKNSEAHKFIGVRYIGFPSYQYLDILRNSIIVKDIDGKVHKLYDEDTSFGRPYINKIAIQLCGSDMSIACHNLPYGYSV